MEMVTVFYATAIYCNCPKCGERVEGWFGDPRGETTTCDHCEHEFPVGKDIDIEIAL